MIGFFKTIFMSEKKKEEFFLVKALSIALIIDKEEAREEYEEIIKILEECGYNNKDITRIVEEISEHSMKLLTNYSVLLGEEVEVVEKIVSENKWEIAYYMKRVVEADRVVLEEEGKLIGRLLPLLEMREEILDELEKNKNKKR